MTVDWAVVPGLLLLLAELVALAAVGYVVVRTVLRQSDERMALAQGLVIGLALWSVVQYVSPAPAGVVAAWILTLALGAGLVWRARRPLRSALRATAVFLAPGTWMLGVGLQHPLSRGWRELALIPVMQIVVADTGAVTYAVFEGALSVRLAP